ncbi:MAG: YhbY family RNA-binding protein [Azovibrio sp.]
MLQLTSDQRRELRARAHALNPVVSIAQHGLTESVLREIDLSLKAHELIKIRIYNDERAEREAYMTLICETLEAAPVQHIGKLLIVWRPCTEPKETGTSRKTHQTKAAPRKTKRSFQ